MRMALYSSFQKTEAEGPLLILSISVILKPERGIQRRKTPDQDLL